METELESPEVVEVSCTAESGVSFANPGKASLIATTISAGRVLAGFTPDIAISTGGPASTNNRSRVRSDRARGAAMAGALNHSHRAYPPPTSAPEDPPSAAMNAPP